ncbi:alpha/beta hydrolase [Pseudonocardia xinjiangensis]|uniref:Alpha/beta hydrolase n=1 Tax=Pseudonocardia xinjiangensis TaxID=75289 RepID=A0ABX1RL88_9PSEU|nr:alpha/beta hydrolase [Pseudonocardia xinjiangensis]NMH80003.1 alpha/beta hydrolase [Pseudonocardia xinjiangensis]
MDEPVTDTLDVPGARLHLETRGAGPLLLFVVGGNGDSAIYGGVAAALADRFTVATYDRRGFARSPLLAPIEDDARIDADADDARRLIAHLGGGPAHVFGSSSGAIVVLELVARHPEVVVTAVAHEPPIATLLPDSAEWLAFFDSVQETYRAEGLWPAMARFGAAVGSGGAAGGPPPDVELPQSVVEMMARVETNMTFWMEHELRQYPRYVPDLDALGAARDRIVPAGGQESREHMPYRPNLVLAERLGLQVVDFVGDHVGYATHPAEFASQLGALLTGPGSVRPGR